MRTNRYVVFFAQHLSPWIQSSDDLERNRAVLSFIEIIRAYQTHSDTDEVCMYIVSIHFDHTISYQCLVVVT